MQQSVIKDRNTNLSTKWMVTSVAFHPHNSNTSILCAHKLVDKMDEIESKTPFIAVVDDFFRQVLDATLDRQALEPVELHLR